MLMIILILSHYICSIVTPLQPKLVLLTSKPSLVNNSQRNVMRTSSTFGCNKIYAYPPPPAPVSFPANE